MVNGYRLRARTTYRRPISKRPIPSICVALILSVGNTASADSTAAQLTPYVAEYATTARGFDLQITRTLEGDSNDHFVLSSKGNLLVAGFHEISVFRTEGEQVHSISYIYQGTGLVNRRRELHFDKPPGAISSLYKDEWYELPYASNTLDRMNQIEQVRLWLLNNASAEENLTMRVASGKRVKDTQWVFKGEEVQQTPLGDVSTVRFERLHNNSERRSEIWLATDWDYLLVKMSHTEGDTPVEMLLNSVTFAEESVSVN
ncbi:MAG: DUF3108 domain-containing protein [Pseudomonadota bacterium]